MDNLGSGLISVFQHVAKEVDAYNIGEKIRDSAWLQDRAEQSLYDKKACELEV